MASGIQKGAVTQSQLQVMTLQSFSTMKTVPRRAAKETPPVDCCVFISLCV